MGAAADDDHLVVRLEAGPRGVRVLHGHHARDHADGLAAEVGDVRPLDRVVRPGVEGVVVAPGDERGPRGDEVARVEPGDDVEVGLGRQVGDEEAGGGGPPGRDVHLPDLGVVGRRPPLLVGAVGRPRQGDGAVVAQQGAAGGVGLADGPAPLGRGGGDVGRVPERPVRAVPEEPEAVGVDDEAVGGQAEQVEALAEPVRPVEGADAADRRAVGVVAARFEAAGGPPDDDRAPGLIHQDLRVGLVARVAGVDRERLAQGIPQRVESAAEDLTPGPAPPALLPDDGDAAPRVGGRVVRRAGGQGERRPRRGVGEEPAGFERLQARGAASG